MIAPARAGGDTQRLKIVPGGLAPRDRGCRSTAVRDDRTRRGADWIDEAVTSGLGRSGACRAEGFGGRRAFVIRQKHRL